MSLEPPPWPPARAIRDGVRLAHVEAGPAAPGSPPLVFVHGWTGDHGIFTPQIHEFSKTRRVVAIDLRGHGASDAPEQDYTVAGFADDIAWQCRELGLTRPVVVGHSFGGVVGLELCGSRPELASGLVMIDSEVLPPEALRGHPDTLRLLEAVAGPDYRAFREANAWAGGSADDDPARRRGIFDTYILGPCRNTPQHVALSTLRNAVLHHDPVPGARACRVPMAYIASDAPDVAGARDLDRLRQLCPQLVTAKTLMSRHFSTIEVADQVNAMIARFLAAIVRSPDDRARAGLP